MSADTLWALAMLLAASGFAGFLAGLFGVGGGVVLVPALFFVLTGLGYGGAQVMQICVATSLAVILLTSARSVLAHHKHGAVDWQILRQWGPAIALGALLGVAAVARLRSEVLVAVFGTLATCIGLYLAFGRETWRLGSEMPGPKVRLWVAPLIGFLSALVGIGGGSFGVPLMTLYGVPMHRAVATAAGFGVVIAVPSVLGFLWVAVEPVPPLTLGAINLVGVGLALSMTLLTAPSGARAAHALPAWVLRRGFAVFVLFVAANMLRQVTWS